MGPRNRFQGMNSASLCSLAGRYNNPIPPRFLAPIDSLKIPAQATQPGGIGSLESILGFSGSEPVFVNLLRSPEIDSKHGGRVRQPFLSYWPASVHRLAESIPGLLKHLQIRALERYIGTEKLKKKWRKEDDNDILFL